MQLGLGVLRWPPSMFWSATTFELQAAADGLRRSMPGPTGPGSQAPTRAEVKELKATLGVD